MSLFKTNLVYHPPIPAVSLKQRQQAAGTGLDHNGCEEAGTDPLVTCKHWLCTAEFTQHQSETTR